MAQRSILVYVVQYAPREGSRISHGDQWTHTRVESGEWFHLHRFVNQAVNKADDFSH